MDRVAWLESLVDKANALIERLEQELDTCKRDRSKLIDDFWNMTNEIENNIKENRELKIKIKELEVKNKLALDLINEVLDIAATKAALFKLDEDSSELDHKLTMLSQMRKMLEDNNGQDSQELSDLRSEYVDVLMKQDKVVDTDEGKETKDQFNEDYKEEVSSNPNNKRRINEYA